MRHDHIEFIHHFDKDLIHFWIRKNGSITHHHITYEPDDWEAFKVSVPLPANHDKSTGSFINTTLDITNALPEVSHKFWGKRFANYYKSCYIRDPLKRFPSSIAQDYYGPTRSKLPLIDRPGTIHHNSVDLESSEAKEYFRSFQSDMEEWAKDPSFENLFLKFDVETVWGHATPQDMGWFAHMPHDVTYFEVDRHLVSNYRHWLFKNRLTKYQGTPEDSRHWHRNDSNQLGLITKGVLKDIVTKYMTKDSLLMEWILDFYSNDFEMYNTLKPLCYREGQNSQS